MPWDAVRGIIKRSRNAKNTNVDDEVDVEKMKNIHLGNPKIDFKKLDKNTREYIKDLEAGLSFFKNYSELLEETYLKEKLKKDKKKWKCKRWQKVSNKDKMWYVYVNMLRCLEAPTIASLSTIR